LPYRAPDDRLADAVAEIILRPSDARDRLTVGLFVPDALDEPLGRLEDALVRTLAAEPVLARIRRGMRDKRITVGDPELQVPAALAAGLIDIEEAALVQAAVVARRQVIEVDDFPPEQLTPETTQWSSDPQQTVTAGRSI
jgi:acyl-CoA dehydrogenase